MEFFRPTRQGRVSLQTEQQNQERDESTLLLGSEKDSGVAEKPAIEMGEEVRRGAWLPCSSTRDGKLFKGIFRI